MSASGHQSIRVVRGYLEGVDALPRRAEALGLRARIAFALTSYREGAVDLYFDDGLYLALVAAVAGAVAADRISIESTDDDGGDGTLESLREQMMALPELEREPFERLAILSQGIVRAIILSELWARVGGPDPYHDCYVAAVYSDTGSIDKIEREARAACGRLSAEVVETIDAGSAPKSSIGERIRAAITRSLR